MHPSISGKYVCGGQGEWSAECFILPQGEWSAECFILPHWSAVLSAVCQNPLSTSQGSHASSGWGKTEQQTMGPGHGWEKRCSPVVPMLTWFLQMLERSKRSRALVMAIAEIWYVMQVGSDMLVCRELVKFLKGQLYLHCILGSMPLCLHIIHSYINSGSHWKTRHAKEAASP